MIALLLLLAGAPDAVPCLCQETRIGVVCPSTSFEYRENRPSVSSASLLEEQLPALLKRFPSLQVRVHVAEADALTLREVVTKRLVGLGLKPRAIVVEVGTLETQISSGASLGWRTRLLRPPTRGVAMLTLLGDVVPAPDLLAQDDEAARLIAAVKPAALCQLSRSE